MPISFSRRLPWEAATNPFSQELSALRRAGTPMIDLTVSNPTVVGLPSPPPALLAPLADPAVATYAPVSCGHQTAREAVAAVYRDQGATVDPDDLVLTASTSEAYSYLFRLLADPGDDILAPSPSYPLFDYLAGLDSLRLVPYPVAYDGQWHVALNALAEAIGPRTRAILVVSPNNPTGSYLKTGELTALRQLCATRDLALIVDEVFAEYPLAPAADVVRTCAGERDILTFALGGLSKSCAMPQMKVGWIAIAGPPHLRQAARQRLELIADTFLSVAMPIQHAAPAWLAARQALQAPVQARLRANLATLRDGLTGSAISVLPVEGGWYAILRLPATRNDEAWALDLLRRHRLLVHPGYLYDLPLDACLVVSLLTPCHHLHDATRILRALADAP